MAQGWIFKAKGSPDGLFTVTVRAISDLGYSITHSDAGARTVSFETGMSWRTWQGRRMSDNVVQNGGILELTAPAQAPNSGSGARRG